MRRTQPADVARLSALLCLLSLSVMGCTASGPSEAPDADATAPVVEEPVVPQATFINFLPWGKVDFARGQFPSAGDCNAFVRGLPNYSGYTTAERCQPIDDPVYCTAWQDEDGNHLDCFKGVGGCEVELKRHDLLAESGAYTVGARCEPSSLEDAWARFQDEAKTGE
jgi:predicted small lipoprotein YifL